MYCFLPLPQFPVSSRKASNNSTPSCQHSRTPIRRPRPDPHLIQTTRPIATLHEVRKSLRRTSQTEPSIVDVINHVKNVSSIPDDTDWNAVLAARNKLTVKWLWVVAAVARKAHRTYLSAFPEMSAALSLSDIMQEGVCGLITSVERWDPSKGYPFDAFAFYSVKHAILRALENQSRPIRLPVHVLNKLSKMRKVREHLEMSNGDVSIDNIARTAGLSLEDAELYLNRSRTMRSIDAPLKRRGDESGSSTLREFLVDTSVDVARQVERVCTREAVAELVKSSNLEELERSVLWLKYGLGDGVERVRKDVSRILDVRVEKVRRAELSALKKLRDNVGDDISAWSEVIS